MRIKTAGLLLAFHAPVWAGYVCRDLPGGGALRCRYGDDCGISGGLSVCSSKSGAYAPYVGVREGGTSGFRPAGKAPGSPGSGPSASFGEGCMSAFTPMLLAAENSGAGDWDTKLKYYSQAIQGWAPCDGAEKLADAYTRRGFVYARLAAYENAADDLRAAAGYNPRDPMPHNYLGYVHYDRRRYADAVAEFNRALELGLEIKSAEAAHKARTLRAEALRKQEESARVAAAGRPLTRDVPVIQRNPAGGLPGEAAGQQRSPPSSAAVSLPNPAVAATGAYAPAPQRFIGRAKSYDELSPGKASTPSQTAFGGSLEQTGNAWFLYFVVGLLLSAVAFLGVGYLLKRGSGGPG